MRRTLVGTLMLTLAMSILAAPLATRGDDKPPQRLWVYVGCYTRNDAEGIGQYELDLGSGALRKLAVTPGVKNPSFVAIHPSRKFLYSVAEVDAVAGKPGGAIAAFVIDADTGKLRQLNAVSTGGAGPCHLIVDKAGRHVLAANYGGGSVCALGIADDGQLTPATAFVQHVGSSVLPRQQGPHAHSINLDAANRFAVAADLGLDKLLVYRFDVERGTLTPNDPPSTSLPPGAGPRHFAFHPDGRHAYVINEINQTLTALDYDAESGRLTPIHALSTLPEGLVVEGNSTAEVVVHPSGKFVYGSNRGHDSIAIFAIDAATGRITARGHQSTRGKTPRNFAIEPTGQFLLAANQQSGTIAVFRIDQQSGALDPVGEVVEATAPVCLRFLPAP